MIPSLPDTPKPSNNPSLSRIRRVFLRHEIIIFPVFIFIIMRLLTGVFAILTAQNTPPPLPPWLFYNPSGQTYQRGLPPKAPFFRCVEPWYRYDTVWYVRNAMIGYHPGELGRVFPPFYPILIRLVVRFLHHNYVLAALIVSNISALIMFILCYQLVYMEKRDMALARRTVMALAFFPTAFYFMAGYSESLFLALALGAFLATFKRQWLLAGVLAACAALTRIQGAVLCFPLGAIVFLQERPAGWRDSLVRSLAPLGGILGAGGYMAYAAIMQLGSFDEAYAVEWKIHTGPPWLSVQTYFQRLFSGQTLGFENDNALILVLIIILSTLVLAKLRLPYGLYVWSSLALIMLRFHEGPQFEGFFRYALLLFPCFIVLAQILKRHWTIIAYGLIGLVWQLILLDRFVHWLWVA